MHSIMGHVNNHFLGRFAGSVPYRFSIFEVELGSAVCAMEAVRTTVASEFLSVDLRARRLINGVALIFESWAESAAVNVCGWRL